VTAEELAAVVRDEAERNGVSLEDLVVALAQLDPAPVGLAVRAWNRLRGDTATMRERPPVCAHCGSGAVAMRDGRLWCAPCGARAE
jgi:hypothetical protein